MIVIIFFVKLLNQDSHQWLLLRYIYDLYIWSEKFGPSIVYFHLAYIPVSDTLSSSFCYKYIIYGVHGKNIYIRDYGTTHSTSDYEGLIVWYGLMVK